MLLLQVRSVTGLLLCRFSLLRACQTVTRRLCVFGLGCLAQPKPRLGGEGLVFLLRVACVELHLADQSSATSATGVVQERHRLGCGFMAGSAKHQSFFNSAVIIIFLTKLYILSGGGWLFENFLHSYPWGLLNLQLHLISLPGAPFFNADLQVF